MARIPPLQDEDADSAGRAALDQILASHGRVTNMKRTLAHSPVALHALMTWYDLRGEVVPFLGERLTTLFAHAISAGTDCLICSTFFRRILIEAGENPESLRLDDWEQTVVDYGRQLAIDPHGVSDDLFARLAARLRPEEIVALTAFGGLMVATNLFNNALQVDLDEYLQGYRKEDGEDDPERRRSWPVRSPSSRARRTGRGGRRPWRWPARGSGSRRWTSPGRWLIPAIPWDRPRISRAWPRSAASLGVDCLTFAADVRDDAAVSAAVSATVDRFGRIDILFNNAGICGYGLAHELTEAAWDAMLDINLKGAWLVARRVIPVMIEHHRGVIINNSSVAGLRGMARLSHYAASKWGLVGLTKSWAIELAPYNIRVVALCPTGVNTPMNDGLAMLEGTTASEIAERSAGNLLPMPWIEPQDVAEAVVFLASSRARSITGSEFVLDAGLLTR